jgi:hypothetical protein
MDWPRARRSKPFIRRVLCRQADEHISQTQERPKLAAGLRPASMSPVTTAELWRRGQVGWPRRFPIAQFPNPPLLLAFAGWGLAAESGGTAHEVGRAVFTLGLAVWAWEEAVSGVNWFRRLLGAGALIWIVAGLAGELRGH